MNDIEKEEIDWLKLDNAALIYPSAATKKWNSVFRISVYLKEEVDPEFLLFALKEIMPRFPSFNVYLKRGLFWYYFQKVTRDPVVEKEKLYPCRPIIFKENTHLFRVLYFKNKISLEVFHSITDGFGAISFLNTLLAKYLSLKGVLYTSKKNFLNFVDKPFDEELEDSFQKYADLSNYNSRKEKKAYQFHGNYLSIGKLNVVTGLLDIEKIKHLSRSFNATLTEFLLGVYFKSILEYQHEIIVQKKPIKISVPVNLRRFFPSVTLRNFSSYINIEMFRKDNSLTLAEIIEKVKEQMKNVNKDNLLKNINANVLAQKNIFIRLMPLFLKNLALKISYNSFGETLYTTTMTNMGQVNLPDELKPFVERYEILLGRSKKNKISAGVVSFNNVLSISFTTIVKEIKIIRSFFRQLTDLGCNVKIVTNIN